MINNKIHEPLFHLTKRTTGGSKRAWALRAIAFAVSVLVCGIVTIIIVAVNNEQLSQAGRYFEEYSFEQYFLDFGEGVFGSPRTIWNLFQETAILLIIALAVTPCFKMKFWNIGGEGQVLMGALGAAIVIRFMMGKGYSDGLIIFLSLLLAIGLGVAWAVVPALFKAKWNTNETLLTLMMNYIAVCLVSFFVAKNPTAGSNTIFFDKGGTIPPIGPQEFVGKEFVLFIIVAAVITTIMAIYLKYSKHGYEVAVVGESPNTAKYVGINTKAVIIRTLVLCGVLCGITGFLLVSAKDFSLREDTVGGRGFTGVLISWLGQFNPIFMVVTSFLVVFIQRGSAKVATYQAFGTSYPSVMAGIFFFFIIAVEFFVNYKFVFREDIQAKIDAFNEKVKLTLSKNKKVEEAPPVVHIQAGEEQKEEPAQEVVEEPANVEESVKEDK
ncbi:MAG: ABC transporter permease [Clostridia bacterium]|nr:ABC transporter permease [Clostridia bacterium]